MMSFPSDLLTIGGGSDEEGRDDPFSYMERPGEISGKIIIAAWKAIGHDASVHLLFSFIFIHICRINVEFSNRAFTKSSNGLACIHGLSDNGSRLGRCLNSNQCDA